MQTLRRAPLGRFTLVLVVVALILAAGTALAGAGADEPKPPLPLTTAGAARRAIERGPDGIRAGIDLERLLLQAGALAKQHDQGAPPAIGGVSDLDKANIEELFPIQASSLQELAAKRYLQRTAALQGESMGTFYQALLAQAAVDVHRAAVERMQTQLEQTKAFFARGAVSELDSLRVQVGAAQAETEYEAARERADLALLQLKVQVGVPLDQPVDLVGSLAHQPRTDLDFLDHLGEALQASTEVAATRGQLAVAEKEAALYVEHPGHTPHTIAGYREKTLAQTEAQVAEEQARLNVQVHLQMLHNQIEQADRQVTVARQQLELADRARRIAQLRYEAGLATITDVLEAETGLLQAELGQLQAITNYRITSAQLDGLLGRGLSYRQQHLREVQQRVDDLYDY